MAIRRWWGSDGMCCGSTGLPSLCTAALFDGDDGRPTGTQSAERPTESISRSATADTRDRPVPRSHKQRRGDDDVVAVVVMVVVICRVGSSKVYHSHFCQISHPTGCYNRHLLTLAHKP